MPATDALTLAVDGAGDLRVTATADRRVHAYGQGDEGLWTLERSAPIADVAVEPSAARVAVAVEGSPVTVWSREGVLLSTLEHQGRRLAWRGDTLAIAGADRPTIALYRMSDLSLTTELEGHQGWVNDVSLSADGGLVASGSSDWTARVWDTSSGNLKGVYAGHRGAVFRVAFSPDEQFLLTGSQDKTARLWELPSTEPVRAFAGFTDWITGVTMLPDHPVVAVVARNGTHRVFQAYDGTELTKVESGQATRDAVRLGSSWMVVGEGSRPVDLDEFSRVPQARPPSRPRLEASCQTLIQCGRAWMETGAPDVREHALMLMRVGREGGRSSESGCQDLVDSELAVEGLNLPEACAVGGEDP